MNRRTHIAPNAIKYIDSLKETNNTFKRKANRSGSF